jgi:hypothetical protein
MDEGKEGSASIARLLVSFSLSCLALSVLSALHTYADNVQVAVRLRPLSQKELRENPIQIPIAKAIDDNVKYFIFKFFNFNNFNLDRSNN